MFSLTFGYWMIARHRSCREPNASAPSGLANTYIPPVAALTLLDTNPKNFREWS